MGIFSKNKKIENVISSHSTACFTSSVIPSRKVITNLGMVKASISYRFCGTYDGDDNLIHDELVKKANSVGGNAIINFRYDTFLFQSGGDGWNNAFIIAYGDAVIISDEES
ncbi:YbjQ family protein [Morganella morganii]|uniref:YbjQ family protein n=1 Tax=Morganella morganii TaxID=582 RepID=UPI0021D1ABC4|nr:YbjQ family protein [Morganella morganii]MCU6213357.1 YbjQ family protein [Morganella morganii]